MGQKEGSWDDCGVLHVEAQFKAFVTGKLVSE